MDINLLRMQQFNIGHVPFSSGAASVPSGESGAFDDLLRRVQNSQTQSAIPNRQASSPRLPAFVQDEKLFELCLELETFLMKNLIRSMRNTVQRSGFIDTGFAGEIYEDMLFDEYARKFARNAGFGFAEMAYRDLTRHRN